MSTKSKMPLCRFMEKRSVTLVIFLFGILLSTTSLSAQSGTSDIGWPRQVSDIPGKLIYYQPQVEEWKDYKNLTALVAFSLTPKNGKEVMGVATLSCETLVDKESRMVYLRDVRIPDIRFPSLSADSSKLMGDVFRKLMPTESEPIALDRLMADIKESKKDEKGVDVVNDPPPIFYSNSPAILLMVEGEPVLSPIEKLDVEFVVNTNWDLFYDKKKKDYFLLTNTGWLQASELKGPWNPTQTLPKDMSKLPSGEHFDDVKKMIPPPPASKSHPTVFYTKVPSELILIQGPPVYTKINGTHLLYIANSDNNIFLDNISSLFYVLFSGRWFSAKSFEGPWKYAGNDLPGDFAKIPKNSPRASVLSSVPGTTEATDAVLLAQIPQTAIVNKAEVEAKVNVVYDGDPKFADIEKTSMKYATNTAEKVIQVGDLYYLCFQGVWFMSAKPQGPWKTADSVPQEIYTIPSSSPVYNVTYVTQTNATETTVESSTSAGYYGMFAIGMTVGVCLAYGSGYYYPPYMYYGPIYPYPIYRPYPCAYGAGFAYNPYTGGYVGGRVAYGPYGAARTTAWYNPSTGRYGRSATVQTPYGGRTAASAYNPYTGGYASTRQGHNAYAQWGTSVASRGNQWVQTGHVTTGNGTTGGYRTSNGQSGIYHKGDNGTAIKTKNGVYAGQDGNVYKKNENGGWSQYNNGGWNQVDRGKATQQNLNASENARRQGQQQAQQFQNSQHSSNRGGGGFSGGGRGGGFGGGRRGR
jgi:hypothetical protein